MFFFMEDTMISAQGSFNDRFSEVLNNFHKELSDRTKKGNSTIEEIQNSVETKKKIFENNLRTWIFQSECFKNYWETLFNNGKNRLFLSEKYPVIFLIKDPEIILLFSSTMDKEGYLCVERFFDETTFEKFCKLLFQKFGQPK